MNGDSHLAIQAHGPNLEGRSLLEDRIQFRAPVPRAAGCSTAGHSAPGRITGNPTSKRSSRPEPNSGGEPTWLQVAQSVHPRRIVHRRFTRRRERQQAGRLGRAVGAESGAESALEVIGQRRARLGEELAEWKAWTAEHRHEVSRLREIDSLIAEQLRQHRPSPDNNSA